MNYSEPNKYKKLDIGLFIHTAATAAWKKILAKLAKLILHRKL
jgi:hypothetical protein